MQIPYISVLIMPGAGILKQCSTSCTLTQHIDVHEQRFTQLAKHADPTSCAENQTVSHRLLTAKTQEMYI